MAIFEFLSLLNTLDIKIGIEDGQLRFRAPKGAMTAELKEQIKERKAEIIAFLQEAQTATQITSLSLVPVARDKDLPLSFAQQRMWFLSQLDGESTFYNESFQLRIVGKLSLTALEQSINEIVRRHEVLRTNFSTVEGVPFQVIRPSLTLSIPVIDVQDFTETAVQEIINQEVSKSFDLGTDTLIRVTLLQQERESHLLLITMHHIIIDGWSMGVFFKELEALYPAFIQGKLSPLTDLTIQYADFALWQREWLTKEVQDKQLEYWKQQLTGAPPLLELPTDYPRPPEQTFAGATVEFHIDAGLTSQLVTLSQKSGVTLFMTLLTAFAVILHRYSGQDDICIGSPFANRNRREIDPLIGFFVNTLVLRTQMEGNPSFSQLLEKVRSVVWDAYAHQDIPFEQVVEALQPERSLGYNPLFQVSFVLENFSLDTLELPGISLTPEIIDRGTAKFDLSLSIWQTQKGLIGSWEYNSDIFAADTITRMINHFQTLLTAIVKDPQQKIGELPLLTESERHQLLVEWNHTQVKYPQDKCIHQLFEEQVEKTPDAVAVVFDNQQLTYFELNCRANQLAHYLKSLGVKPDTLVGICVERSLNMIVGLLGILKAGGAYVPLDSEYPIERLSFMLEDAQVKILVTQQELINKLPEHTAQLVRLNSDWENIVQHSNSNPVTTATAKNLAYIIYTSGSTGQPKGVLVNHSNVTRLFAATDTWYNFNNQDVWTMFHSYAFDFSVWEVWGALLYGGRVVVVPYLVSRSPESFYQLLCREKVTILNQTPSAFRQLIQVEQGMPFPPASDLNLRLVIFGGEALEINSLQPWFERHGDKSPQLVNMYGITETTVHVTYRPLGKSDLQSTASVIGRPIPDLQIYLLDEHQQPVPIGVPGEMYVGGAGLTRGYLNRPEFTEQRFISNPFAQAQGSKLYRTGDKSRYLPNGDLEYLGRIDNQVKIRGFRIELGEIEALLASHPAVWENVVIVREDEPGDKRLIAYLVPHPETSVTVSQLRSFLKQKLPHYMIPSALVLLKSLPLTPNGKIDRRALPKPELDSTQLERYVAPRNPIEELLTQIWAQVLKGEKVGIADNFFELGGHSLLATQLVSRIRNIFKIELPLRELFASATVAELAQVIDKLQHQKIELSEPPILPRAKNTKLPLSFAQQRLWFLDKLEPNSALYNIPVALRLQGNLDPVALEKSLQEIINRHEALRTNFITVDEQPIQIIRKQETLNREQEILSIVNLKYLSTSEQENAVQQIVEKQAIEPFNLATEALIRTKLVVLSQTEHILLVCVHHIVFDGWSMGVFTQELAELYNAYSQGQQSPLAPLAIQYADFALWQRNWLQEDVLESQLSYWQKQLQDSPALLALPTDRPRPAVQTFVGAHQYFALSVELTDKLLKLSQEQGCTLFMTLLAAYDTLLYRYTGQLDILVGTPIANRDRAEIEGLIGFFVNTLVLRSNLADNPSFSELLTRAREMAMGAYSHQNLSFEMLVEALQPERDLSYTPLFQVMFALQNASVSELELNGLTVSQLPIESVTAKFDLTLAMENTADGLVGMWEYNTDLFDHSTIERMTGHFVTLLEGIVANPESTISQLPLLTPVEQQQLLVEWNNTQTDYPANKCIHQLFEEQVEKTPNAVAVVFEDKQLTYQQLNTRANQLAHYLRSLGIKPDTLVGICVERSVEMIVGLLGILKAGGAYVPLDPEYPSERLSFILEDTAAAVLLTQQQLIQKLPQHQAKIVCLDTDWEIICQSNQENCLTSVQTSNLAYIMYTSGSTGKPKGVEVVHRGVNRLLFGVNYVHLDATQTFLQLAPIAFDASTFEIWGALLHGAKCVLFPGTIPTSQNLREEIKKHGITILWLTAALFNSIIENDKTALSGIKQLLIGGEALSVTHVQKAIRALPLTQIINGYGPTESTTFTCCYPITRQIETDIESIPIGSPIANTQVYIFDKYLQPVPIGVPGELHIGGLGLAKGYLNRPELTQEKFISNPFNNSKLYKTGDLARYLPDGNIEYLGRIDNQVKIRGFRIELGEIEAVLNQHSDVQVSCVITREDSPGDKRLVAYVVGHQENKPIISEIRPYLKTKLPEYMIPSAVVLLESLPLTPNGKIDRRALPKPDLHSEVLEKYVAPRTPIEELLIQSWAQVLKLQQVGIHDNFFELGGHSLLATQLVSRIRNIFKVELPLRELFAKATVAELSQLIGQLQQQNLEIISPPILPRVEKAQTPLSYAQQRLWFLDQLEPNSAVYNIPLALRLTGKLNQAALEQSLQAIIHRHEALRTNFITVDGQPTQIIRELLTLNREQGILSIVDLQHLPTTEQDIATQQLTKQQAIEPFDLARQPLIRATLILLNETEQVLLLCIHHIVSDGWSMGVFTQELAQLYDAYSGGHPSPLAPPPIQYADFAIWQRNWLQGDVLESQLSYWQQQLQDAPALLALPTDRPRPAVQTVAGAHQYFALSVELTDKLVKLSQEQGCTLFMTLLAAYDTLLYRYTGQSDILVGSPIANRDRAEIEGLIGFFVNTLVLRSNLADNPSFSELLNRVREMAMGAYSHQNLPFEMLVEALQPERDLSYTPLFQVMFALHNAPVSELELNGLTVSQLPIESVTAKFDLTLAMENTTQGLVGVWEYNTDLFDHSTIERMTGHLVTLLDAIVANPNERISQLPLLTVVEQQQLVDWNDTQVEYPQDNCIHQLFEEQVQKTPDAVAVVFENQQLTYQQLNCRANQLAHYLRSLSVKPDTLVGICVERSLEMVVGLLGILKAGGAYVPLDSDYPTERLRFMVEDTQVAVLLTQQHLIERLPDDQKQIICLDTDWEVISQSSQENLTNAVTANNLAYLIYTSGSTGQPKGVMIAHDALLNLVFWHQRTFEITALDKATQVASIAFDAAVWELWPYLTAGASIYLVKSEILISPVDLQDWLQEKKITISFLPTPVAEQLLSLEWTDTTTLRTMLTGGDKLHQYPLNLVPFQLVNNYGPTENTVVTTSGKVVSYVPSDHISPPIGRPIDNTQVYILDQYLQPVPIGVPGELHISGTGLARGYLKRPELTQEKFISNPFYQPKSQIQNPKLYKTGDLVRYLADGRIEYLGRIGNQVKIRGFRIELGEIEAALTEHEDVQICCVVALVGNSGEKCLVAYVGTQKDATLTTNELRQFLADKLPGYMLPSAFVILNSLPLTPNGKVDRRALPNPNLHQEISDYVMPNTEVERIIADIWQQALGKEKVGIYNNFFELGGHSLLLVKVNQQIQEKLSVELAIVDLFNYPTVQSLSQYLINKINQNDKNKSNNQRPQNQTEIKSLRNQQLQSRQQYRSQRKR